MHGPSRAAPPRLGASGSPLCLASLHVQFHVGAFPTSKEGATARARFRKQNSLALERDVSLCSLPGKLLSQTQTAVPSALAVPSLDLVDSDPAFHTLRPVHTH